MPKGLISKHSTNICHFEVIKDIKNVIISIESKNSTTWINDETSQKTCNKREFP